MAENSGIAWTDDTFNPWMGCVKVSAGCKFCYAETLVTGRMRLPLWGLLAQRRVTSDNTWSEPRKWDRKAKAAGVRRRVFSASLADVFEERSDLIEPRRRLFRLIAETPHLDWLLLTKRPEGMVRLAVEAGWPGDWPANVWAGTTVEDREQAEARIPHLLRVPARIRFLSMEPLLERTSPDLFLCPYCNESTDGTPDPGEFDGYRCRRCLSNYRSHAAQIHWVIVGGESGPAARPFHLEWARDLLRQCRGAGVPFFFKQMGSFAFNDNTVVVTRHPKGGDPAEWPADLRVQEFPGVE